MEKQLSFSEKTKDGIIGYNWSEDLLLILFYSFIRTNGSFKNGEFILKTTLKRHKNKILDLFEKFYKIKPEINETDRIINFKVKDKIFVEKFASQLRNLELKNTNQFGAYIAGAFLGKGWINNSNSKFYHFEIRVKNIDHSLDLIEAFDAVGIKVITLLKDGWYYTYIKKSLLISDVLKLMYATSSLLEFEDQRIQRDFISNMTKLDSIEPYNQSKTSQASERQIIAIKRVFNSDKVLLLNPQQKKLAEIRLENPHLSLHDLSIVYFEKYQKEWSKSSINNWLKKIEDLAL